MANFLTSSFRLQESVTRTIWLLLIILLLVILLGVFNINPRFANDFCTPMINTLFLFLLLFINIQYLIPEFLKKGNWLQYGISVVVFLLIISPLKIFSLYVVYYRDPMLQSALLNDQILYFAADVLVIFLSATLNLSFTWFNQQRLVRELQKQNIQSEIKFLKAQINPHFLFNTLNNIYSLSLKKDDKAPEAILKLSDILRYILYECNEREVLLKSEWKHILDFIELEKLRMSKEMSIFLEYDVEDEEARIAPLILMTFVENAFKHGTRTDGKEVDVSIRLNQSNNNGIHLEVANSKGNRLNIGNARSHGIGLENVRKRLRLLYPQRFRLDTKASQDQYIVNLKIKP